MLDYETLKKINFESLVRTDLGANLRFSEIVDYAREMATNFLTFQGRESGLLNTEREIVSAYFGKYNDLINRVKNFKQEDSENPSVTSGRKRELIQEFKDTHISFTREVLPILLKIQFSQKEKDFEEKTDTFNKKIVESEELLNKKITNIENNFGTSLTNFQNTISRSEDDFNTKIQTDQTQLGEINQIKQEAKNFTVSKLVYIYEPVSCY